LELGIRTFLLLTLAWQGNFESWIHDPLHVRPIAHAIWDPHFGQPAVEAFTQGGAAGPDQEI
jgi:photosystem I P700 chlorophyll a apoprotein A2